MAVILRRQSQHFVNGRRSGLKDIDLGAMEHNSTESKMNCSEFENKLSDYFDGLLAGEDASMFRGHALQCRPCRALMDDVKATIKICREQDRLETPEMLETALMAISTEHALLGCAGFEELITDFLDGFVSAPTYHRFEEHADECGECSSLLTGVVYAVAACHSVHTFEEIVVPKPLIARLNSLMGGRKPTLVRRSADRLRVVVDHLIPASAHSARWTFATSLTLAIATLLFMFFGFSDDGTAAGIYRQAHVRASELYSHSTDVYSETDKVVARLERVGYGIGEFWDTLGGETKPDGEAGAAQTTDPKSDKRVPSSEKN